jgi:hypothetical protein
MSARYAAALEVLVRAAADARSASRDDLKMRIEALKGNLQARMGLVDEGVASIRAALERALNLGNAAIAGERTFEQAQECRLGRTGGHCLLRRPRPARRDRRVPNLHGLDPGAQRRLAGSP